MRIQLVIYVRTKEGELLDPIIPAAGDVTFHEMTQMVNSVGLVYDHADFVLVREDST